MELILGLSMDHAVGIFNFYGMGGRTRYSAECIQHITLPIVYVTIDIS